MAHTLTLLKHESGYGGYLWTKVNIDTIRRLFLSRSAPWSLLWQSLTWQGSLIAVNFFLAFRGVQIWKLSKRSRWSRSRTALAG